MQSKSCSLGQAFVGISSQCILGSRGNFITHTNPALHSYSSQNSKGQLTTFSPSPPPLGIRRHHHRSGLGPSNSCSALAFPSGFQGGSPRSDRQNIPPKFRTVDTVGRRADSGGDLPNERPETPNVQSIHGNRRRVPMATDSVGTWQQERPPKHERDGSSLERNAASRDRQLLRRRTGERCSSQASRPVVPPPPVPAAHLDPRMPLISETSAAGNRDDDVTTTSGSYVIDAGDLCQEMDELFLREVQVCS